MPHRTIAAFGIALLMGCLSLKAQEPAPATTQIRGVLVHAETMEPLEGLALHARGFSDFREEVHAMTDSEGRFALTGLTPGSYIAWTVSEEFLAVMDPTTHPMWIRRSGETVDLGKIKVFPACKIQVKVVTEVDQRPIAGANVAPKFPWAPEICDERGMVTLSVPRGSQRLEISAPGFADVTRYVIAQSDRTIVDLAEMAPAGILAGRVMDMDENPIEGAQITATSHAIRWSQFEFTGPDGTFEITCAPLDQEIELRVIASHYISWENTRVVDSETRRMDLTVELHPSSAAPAREGLSGVLVNGAGEPIQDARIRAIQFKNGSPWPMGSATTNEDGRFTLNKPPPEEINGLILEVYHACCLPKQVTVFTEDRRHDLFLTVDLEPGLQVEGQVYDDQGKPLQGVWVGVLMSGRDFDKKVVTTDLSGHFTIGGLDEAAHFMFSRPGYDSELRTFAELRQSNEIILTPASTLRGIVLSESHHTPLQQFELRLRTTGSLMETLGEIPHREWSTVVDPDGAFSLDNIDARLRANVEIRAEGFLESALPLSAFHETNTKEKPVSIFLQPARPIQGVVVNPQAQGIPGISIRMIGMEPQNARVLKSINRRTDSCGMIQHIAYDETTETGEDGRFTLPPPTTHLRAVLFLEGPDLAPMRLAWSTENADDQVLTIHAEPGARMIAMWDHESIEGRVQAEAWDIREDLHLQPRTLERGRAVFEPLAPGPHRIRLSWGPEPSGDLTRIVDVATSQDTTVHLEIPRVFEISGTALWGGQPLNQGTVELRSACNANDFRTTVTDVSGNFVFQAILPGVYELRAFPAGVQPIDAHGRRRLTMPQRVQVIDQSVDQVFSFPFHPTVRGQLPEGFRSGALNLIPLFISPMNSRPASPIAEDGSFSFDFVPPGNYALQRDDGISPVPQLLTHVEVSGDRPECELGELDMDDRGTLVIHLEDSMRWDECGGALRYGEETTFPSLLLALSKEKTLRLENLPTGRIQISAIGLAGHEESTRIARSGWLDAEIEKNTEKEVHLTLATTTALMGAMEGGGRDLGNITSLQLTQPQTGRILEGTPIPAGLSFDLLFALPEKQLIIQEGHFSVLSIAPGEWELILETDTGLNLERTVHVEQGRYNEVRLLEPITVEAGP